MIPSNKPKTKHIDRTWKIYAIDHGTSMCLFKKLTHYNAEIRVNALTALYPDWQVKFKIAK